MHILYILLCTTVPVLSSKILYVAPINTYSNHMWNTLLATEITKRGHEVTYIGAMPLKNQHPNLTHHFFDTSEETKKIAEVFLLSSLQGPPSETLRRLDDFLISYCEKMFEYGVFKDLIDSKNKDTYDLVMIAYAGHDCLLGLGYRFRAPIIILNSQTYSPHWMNRIMGVPLFHLAPHSVDISRPPFDFWKRMESLRLYFLNDFEYYTRVMPAIEKSMKKGFGENVPSVENLTENIALAIVNMPDWANKIPIPANVIPIPGIHLVEAKPLNAEMETFLDGAENGVILISFGTRLPVKYVDHSIFQEIASAVGKLKQKVLWKWDFKMNDESIDFPPNVLRLPWISQNDLLGHPKMRLFVSHCGGQSTLEAIYHGVPVLGVPGFWDQGENSNRIEAEGAGLRLDFSDINKTSFYEATTEILNNPKYLEGAQRLKSVIRDQPIKPMDRAMFWIEFVIRNRGAHHLRPFLWDLPHPYTLLIDLAIVVTVALICVFLSCVILLLCLRVCLCHTRRSKTKTE